MLRPIPRASRSSSLPGASPGHWRLGSCYAVGTAGITAGWLVQNAYHAGRLAAAQPGITLADPAISTAWGIAVFGEQVRAGSWLALIVVPLSGLIGSVFLLSRSAVLQGTAGESPGEGSEEGAAGRHSDTASTP